MIAVIADDFTGAAELAGICLRYGLQAKLYTGPASYETSDVCIVSSDSRSMLYKEAIETTRSIIESLQQLHPSFIYKKTDSVLRGFVLDEVKAQMQLQGKTRAIIIPANPSLGRTIVEGHYYIHGQLITETAFFSDPEFPVRSSEVKAMIRDTADEVSVVANDGRDDRKAISIAETSSLADIDYWVAEAGRDYLLAGAGDFFERLLAASFQVVPQIPATPAFPYLFICGTMADDSRGFVQSVSDLSNTVVYLQQNQLTESHAVLPSEQIAGIKNIVKGSGKLILAIEHTQGLAARQVREAMADIVKQLQEELCFREIFIEGGSTAAAILNRLDLHSFDVVDELQRGVVRMGSRNVFITVKPGSYPLPDHIRHLFLTKPFNQQP